MKIYKDINIRNSLRKVGLKKNDIIYINPEIYKFGKLFEAKNKNDYFGIFFKNINKIIGKNGTIVVNSYTFQTLRYNKSFVYEKTISSSGKFSEYIRKNKKSLRSNHPVFSVTAYGKYKNYVCKNNSLNNYGNNSPYQKFLKLNGKILNLGMGPWLNPFIHVAEMLAGVPYFYNKFTKVNYYKKNKKINKNFSSYVRFLNLKLMYDYKKLKKKLLENKVIKSAPLGSSYVHLLNAREYVDTILDLLDKDQFALLKKAPNFKKGRIPFG